MRRFYIKVLWAFFVFCAVSGWSESAHSKTIVLDASSSGLALKRPIGVAASEKGVVWVADSGNNRVLRFSPSRGGEMEADLVLGQKDFASQAALSGASGLDTPVGVTLDKQKRLWIADFGNNRVLRFDPPFKSGMEAALVLGQATMKGSGPALNMRRLSGPSAVEITGYETVWVSDSNNNRVLKFLPPIETGMPAASVLVHAIETSCKDCRKHPKFETSSGTSALSGFSSPRAIEEGPEGGLWVSDFSNSRILVFHPPVLKSKKGESFTGGKRTPLSAPYGLAWKKNVLWVADSLSNRVVGYEKPLTGGAKEISPVLEKKWGSLNHPTGLASGKGNRLWIADTRNNRVVGVMVP